MITNSHASDESLFDDRTRWLTDDVALFLTFDFERLEFDFSVFDVSEGYLKRTSSIADMDAIELMLRLQFDYELPEVFKKAMHTFAILSCDDVEEGFDAEGVPLDILRASELRAKNKHVQNMASLYRDEVL